MSSSRRAPATPAPKRNTVVVVIDLIVGSFLALVGLGVSYILVITETQLLGVLDMCSGPANGLRCNGSFLSGIVLVSIIITVFSGALTAGMVIVNALRKRAVWFWPVIGMIISIAVFYGAAALAGLVQPSS